MVTARNELAMKDVVELQTVPGGVIDGSTSKGIFTGESIVCWTRCFENEPTPEMTILMNLLNPHTVLQQRSSR
jgi:hypothetical protein